ncbi:hypothetical protein [Amycolatopsis pigmentata]|uniref:Uncharacterized protein n=1 Tax=Amycolatopsis pigmentata TaxID=450801 RepID=A0ABW5G4T0_9PSEU
MGFSPKLISWREWVGLGAGLVAVAALFLPWTTLSTTRPDVEEALRALPADDVARDAWTTGFLAWFPSILLLLTGIVVVLFGQNRTARISGLPQLWLIAAAVAVVLLVFGSLTIGHEFDENTLGLLNEGGISTSAGIGRYLAVAGGAVSLVVAILDARSLRRRGTRPKRS